MFRFFRQIAPSRKGARERALDALEAGDYRQAEALISALLEGAVSADDRAFLLNKRGVARIGLRLRDDACADFAAALECQANFAPALSNLGNLLLEEGRVDDAIVHYEAAIEADPEYARAYVNLAAAQKRAGRYDDAVRALRRGHRLEGQAAARPRKRL